MRVMLEYYLRFIVDPFISMKDTLDIVIYESGIFVEHFSFVAGPKTNGLVSIHWTTDVFEFLIRCTVPILVLM